MLRVVTRLPTRSLAELAMPIPVVIVRLELVDMPVLAELGDGVTITHDGQG